MIFFIFLLGFYSKIILLYKITVTPDVIHEIRHLHLVRNNYVIIFNRVLKNLWSVDLKEHKVEGFKISGPFTLIVDN